MYYTTAPHLMQGSILCSVCVLHKVLCNYATHFCWLGAIQTTVEWDILSSPCLKQLCHLIRVTLLKKESCCVTVLSRLAVTGKACTCPIMKAALAEVD